MADVVAVPEQIRLSLEAMPGLLASLERAIVAYNVAAEAATLVTGDDDERYDALLEATGAGDLGDALEVVARRILTGLHGRCEVSYGMGSEPWPAEDARAAIAGFAARLAG